MKKQVNPWIVLVILFLVSVLLSDLYFLWKPYSFQVEGDVLIHLVFSRNMAEGKFFQYGYDQLSRAGTSFLWESLMAGAGHLTGLADSQEGFLALARGLSALLLAAFSGLCYTVLKRLNAPVILRVLVPLACVVHPFTFYWCIANPMETSLALVLMMLLVLSILQADRFRSIAAKAIVFSLLSFALFLTRPELILLAAVAVALMSVKHLHSIDWSFMFSYGVVLLVLLVSFSLYLHQYDLSIFASAGSARRLGLRFTDTVSLPILNIRFNPDAWILGVIFFPLVWGGFSVKDGGSKFMGRLAVFWFLVLAMFFSFYFCSTWRGRYLLPVLAVLAPLSAVGLWASFKDASFFNKAFLFAWLAVAFVLPLKPLAAKAKASSERMSLSECEMGFVVPEKPTRLLVQEVQSVYYYPMLIPISTDGLIDLNAVDAWKSDVTVYEFILYQKPDWIGFGLYYLQDPEGVQDRIREAAFRKESIQIGDIRLDYLGILKGSGDVFEAHYKD